MLDINDIIARLTNTKTLTGIISAIVLILQTCGLQFDSDKVMIVVNSLCTIGLLLGIFNRDGMTSKEWNK